MTARVRLGLDYAVVFVAYVATARLGLSFDALAGIATTVWPPTGIALAALVLRGPHLWPAVALAALPSTSRPASRSGARRSSRRETRWRRWWARRLLRRFAFDPRLARLRDVLLLVGLAALASTLISATFGVAAAALANLHRAESYPVFWAVWWLGDAMGDLLIAPLICVWAPPIRLSRRPLRWLEGLLLAVALTLVSMMVFRRPVRHPRGRADSRHLCHRAAADLGGVALRAARDHRRAAAGRGDRRDGDRRRRAAISRRARPTNAC